jgi:hypothetical protein
MSKAKMERARELIQAKRYDEARNILETVNHPTAANWLAKLDEIAPSQLDDIPDPDWSKIGHTSPPVERMSKPGRMIERLGDPQHIKRMIAKTEIRVNELNTQIEDHKRQRTAATVAVLIGIFLTPVGIGLLLLLVGLPAYFSHSGSVRKKERERSDLMAKIAMARAEL